MIGALVPSDWHGSERIAVSVMYLVLAAWIIARQHHHLPALVRDGFRTSHDALRSPD